MDQALARTVAARLSEGDPLAAHARDELGIDQERLANPWQAAIVSAATFTVGAILPVLVVAVTNKTTRMPVLVFVTLVGLLGLGSAGARLGGARIGRAAVRVVVGGSLALIASIGVGYLAGKVT